jgi:hypothetical protein
MRIDYIDIQNLLSFGLDTQPIAFGPRTTVLVGPNGAGKTNVLRSIKLMSDLMRPPIRRPGFPYGPGENPLLEIPPHQDHIAQDSAVTLGVSFTSDYERDLISLYIAGVIANSLERLSVKTGKSCDRAVARARARELGQEFVSSLSSCSIVARHDRRPQSEWVVEFCFTIGEMNYSYALRSREGAQGIFEDDVFRTATSRFPANTTFLELTDKLNCELPASLSLNQLLPGPSERVNLKLKFARNNDSDLRSELVRTGLIDGFSLETVTSLRDVLDMIMSRSLRSDIDDNGFGSTVTYEQTPLRGAIVPKPTLGNSVLTDLYRWKMGDLKGRQRFERAQQIFRELRGTGEFFDLRASLLPRSENENQSGEPSQTLVNLEPVIVSASNNGEVQANFAGSGAAELVRLSSYLASDKDTVILLDEPAARLHPTAQARLLRFIQQSEAQNVIISHSPSLLPLSNILRIALDKSRRSRVKMLSLADDMNRDDSSSDKEGTVGISAAPSGNAIASQLLKDPILRSIPFAEAVIFVSGYTENIVYPQWLERWQCARQESNSKQTDSRQESNSKQTDSLLSDIQNIAFVNFLGDNNLTHYLRVVKAFGIPWAVIADGNSFRPESDGRRQPIPSIAKQIGDITDKFDNIINTARNDANKHDANKDYYWFKLWKQKLEQCGVFSLATCWRKKDRKMVSCDRPGCNGSLPKLGASCDQSNWHTQMPHAESFEDFCENEPDFSHLREFAWWGCHNKVSRALKLVEEYQTCPSSATEMFDRMSQYLNETPEAPSLVNE